jgi:hypothetical protein
VEPVDLDFERPSQARIYDYLLGGSYNFAVDREAARQLIAMVPDVPLVAVANRAFLRRAVRFLADAGIRQFIDIGSGVPTVGNVHEVAQQTAPESRVVYVDVDPVAVAESRQLLAGNDRTTAILEDACRPEQILAHPAVRALIDLTRPVAILLVSVLHFIPQNDDVTAALTILCDAIVPDSYLVISHVTADGRPQLAAKVTAANPHLATFAQPRTAAEVEQFFAGFELVEPGMVLAELWRPDSSACLDADREPLCLHAGVGRKT